MIGSILESNSHKNLVKQPWKWAKFSLGAKNIIMDDRFYAYATCFSELIQCKAINLEVSLEALPVHPWGQTCIFVLCNTRRHRNLQRQGHKKSPLTFSTQPAYIKSKAERRIDAWIVRRSQCLPPGRSLGNKEQDTSWALIDRGQLNNDQKLFWQRAACGLSSQRGYFGSGTAQWVVTQWADWESMRRQTIKVISSVVKTQMKEHFVWSTKSML